MDTKYKTLKPVLSALGLTESECAIYVHLAEGGAGTISSIARAAQKTRPTSYELVASLLAKGCIQKTKGGKRVFYQAIDPNILLSQFEDIYKTGTQALSSLALSYKNQEFVPEITFHKGIDAIHKIYDDVGTSLPKGGTYFRYTSRSDELPRSALYSRLRTEKEIERLVITSETKKSAKSKDPNRFIKTVPKDFAFDDNVTVLIYGTKIAHIDFNSQSAIVIESPHLARFQEKLFKLLWKKL